LDIDGAVVLEPAPRDPVIHELRLRGIPYVAIGGTTDSGDDLIVDLRHAEVADLLLGHLLERGARRPGLLLGTSNRASQAAFRDRYLALAQDAGFPVVLAEAEEAGGEAAGHEATLELLDR